MSERDRNQRAIAACQLWCKAFDRDWDNDGVFAFARWTGDPMGPDRGYIINIYNPEVMKKVDIILGPNGYAMLKMWKAQADA